MIKRFKVAMNQISGTFQGKIGKGPDSITGDWSDGSQNLPLVLKRTKAKAADAVKN